MFTQFNNISTKTNNVEKIPISGEFFADDNVSNTFEKFEIVDRDAVNRDAVNHDAVNHDGVNSDAVNHDGVNQNEPWFVEVIQKNKDDAGSLYEVPITNEPMNYDNVNGISRNELLNLFKEYITINFNHLGTKELINWVNDEFDYIDWDAISKKNMSDSIMYEFKLKLNWKLVSEYCSNEDTLVKFNDGIYFEFIKVDKLSQKFIKKFLDKLDPIDVLQHNLDDELINLALKNINWSAIKSPFRLPNKIVINHNDKFDWDVISEFLIFDMGTLREICEKLNWDLVSKRKLTHQFIKIAYLRLNWKLVCQYSTLTDYSIRLFQQYIHWDVISEHQKLSSDILGAFYDKFNYDIIRQYQKENLSMYDQISDKLLKEFKWAIEHSNFSIVSSLLEFPNIDLAANDNEAFKLAVKKGVVSIVELLLKDSRVDPAANDNEAFKLASQNGHLEVVKLLLKDGRANPAANNNYVIRIAAKNGHLEVVKLLLKDPRVDPSVDDNNTVCTCSSKMRGKN